MARIRGVPAVQPDAAIGKAQAEKKKSNRQSAPRHRATSAILPEPCHPRDKPAPPDAFTANYAFG
jgi:hypothetical protein